MRRYLQGTLDFACGLYAVINTLARTHNVELAAARRLFADAQEAIAARPGLFRLFARNETDHYWTVSYMLAHARASHFPELEVFQPFSDLLDLTSGSGDILDAAEAAPYLPEQEGPHGPKDATARRLEAERVWAGLVRWLDTVEAEREKRVAILRFHRFLPGYRYPVVSHWTTALAVSGSTLMLHDASSEKGAVMEIELARLLPPVGGEAPMRIVPESVVCVRRTR
jgi:hypothetical protein